MVVNDQLVTTHWDKLSGVGGAVRISPLDDASRAAAVMTHTSAPIVNVVTVSPGVLWTGAMDGKITAWRVCPPGCPPVPDTAAGTGEGAMCIVDDSEADGGVVAMHADGRSRAITGTMEGIVKLWTLDGRGRPLGCTRFADHGAMVVVARLQLRPHQSPTGGLMQLAATGSNDLTVRVYSLLAQTTLLECRGHTDCIASLVFVSATGLASGADDKTIKLWELVSPSPPSLGHPPVPAAPAPRVR